MVGISYCMYIGTHVWFTVLYVYALMASIVTRHGWRFLAANIASISTVIAIANSGKKMHASLAFHPYNLSFLGIKMPSQLEYFPISVILAFAAVLFICDGIGCEIFRKRLTRKALISTFFGSISILLNMTLFFLFSYVVVGIPYFKRLFLYMFIVGSLAQFFFTFFSSVIDVIFCRFPRIRPIYIIVFLATPALYTWTAFKLFTNGSLTAFVDYLKDMISPFTFQHLGYLGILLFCLFFAWLGKAIAESRYSVDVIIYFLSYALTLVAPAVGMFATTKTLNCHRDLAAFFRRDSGIVYTVGVTTTVIIIVALPLLIGSPYCRRQWNAFYGGDDSDDDDKKCESVEEKNEEQPKKVNPKSKKSKKDKVD